MIVVKHQPKSPQAKAEQARRAAAEQRAENALARMFADMPLDRDLAMESIRALIRKASVKALALAGAGRAVGLLAGAAADVCPAFRSEKHNAAEALFARPAEGEK